MSSDQRFRTRHVAPAGAPIGVADLARWAGLAIAGGDSIRALEDTFKARFGVGHCFATSTGRAGLTLLLRAMRRLSHDRDEVILPSYTCFSVAASVVKAGLRPRLVDISPRTLDYAPEALTAADFGRVLAVVATNLYGMPNDLPFITATARRHGAFVIDDAAQAMGARVGERESGTWGDAGLFSLDKGKNVSAIDGGVVATNRADVAAALQQELSPLSGPTAGECGIEVAKALIYFAMLRPWLYWIPNRIPQLQLGRTVFTTDFPLARPSRPLAALARTMVGHLGDFTEGRRRNASTLLAGLASISGVDTIAPVASAAPVYLRLPVLVANAAARDHAVAALNHAGIGATASYPDSLADVQPLATSLAGRVSVPGGRHVARHILTLPTHPFVEAADIAAALDVLSAVVAANGSIREGTATCVA
jgi:dTDP-4-amino-4,6-dideoxygalactose transaminase